MQVVNLKKISPILVIITLLLTLTITGEYIERVYGRKLYLAASAGEDIENIVIIDAGHGGEDCGAIGVNGVLEKDVNLSVALAVGKELETRGYVVVYTRTDDRMLYKPEENIKGMRKLSDLKGRCEVAQRYSDALLVSIHMNSFSSAKYSGLQVYYSENQNSSKDAAQKIQNSVRENLQPNNNRKIKSGKDIYLLKNIENPAVLIECGFLTNREECEKLSEKEYQNQLSFFIVCGIIEYMTAKT